jgi:hypothetical protein
MKHQNRISELLHNIFGEGAIQAAAISEQLEDVKYCTEHKMNHQNGGSEKAKWEKALRKAEEYAEQDKTFTIENMKKFTKKVNEFRNENPETNLFDGLSETEHFAVRRFCNYNNY